MSRVSRSPVAVVVIGMICGCSSNNGAGSGPVTDASGPDGRLAWQDGFSPATDGQPPDGAPLDGAPSDGRPVDGALDGSPVDGNPSPDDGAVADLVPGDATPGDGDSDSVLDGASAEAGPLPDAQPDGPTTPCAHPSVVEDCTDGWCEIPAGCFTMGSPPSEPCRNAVDESQHQVTLTRAFEIKQTPTTQDEFVSLRGYNPSGFVSCGGDCPVETINWHEAAATCNALSDKAGLAKCYTCNGTLAQVTCGESPSYPLDKTYDCPGYRLPTEAEWEYAYRAGTTTALFNGPLTECACRPDPNADALGWYCGNSGKTLHPVGQKLKNPWGLFISGNVYTWTHDRYKANLGTKPVTDPAGPPSGFYHGVRGGSWTCDAKTMRAARRMGFVISDRFNYIGVRCVRSLPSAP